MKNADLNHALAYHAEKCKCEPGAAYRELAALEDAAKAEREMGDRLAKRLMICVAALSDIASAYSEMSLGTAARVLAAKARKALRDSNS
jgi:hypothetical protein